MRDTNPPGGLTERVAENVRVEMARRRMTQRTLADETGLTQSYISRRMACDVPFTTDDLERIARALRVPLAAILPAAEPAA